MFKIVDIGFNQKIKGTDTKSSSKYMRSSSKLCYSHGTRAIRGDYTLSPGAMEQDGEI